MGKTFQHDERFGALRWRPRNDQNYILAELRDAYYMDFVGWIYDRAQLKAAETRDETMLEFLQDEYGAKQLIAWMLENSDEVRGRVRRPVIPYREPRGESRWP